MWTLHIAMCTYAHWFYPVSMDYGLSVRTAVRGHAISGLPHKPATIFHGYIVRSLSFSLQRRSLFFSVPLVSSLVRNPVSIEERFNPDESTRASARKRGRVKSPYYSGEGGYFPRFYTCPSTRLYERGRDSAIFVHS